MNALAAAAPIQAPLAAEDAGRADFYALLAALLHQAPDDKLLRSLALSPPLEGGDPALSSAWSALCAAAGVFEAEAAAEEYESLFVGVGVAKVSIYAGHYAGSDASGTARLRVIADLAGLGLARAPHAHMPEDHFAGLFEVMRVLVAGGAGRLPASLEEQKRFYEAHVKPGIGKFFEAVERTTEANLYRKVAALGKAFAAVESESFNLG